MFQHSDNSLRSVLALSFVLLLFALFSCQLSPMGSSKKDKQLEKVIETKILLAQNKLEQARPQAALPELRALDMKYPNTPMVLNMLGLVHLALKNYKKALENTKKAYLLDQSKVAFGLNLSSVYLSIGRPSIARKVLNSLLKSESYSYKERLFHNIALSYEQEKKWKEAEGYYEAALVENPVYYLSMINLAKLYEKRSLRKKAFLAYKKASQYCPTCYEARKKLAGIYAPRKIEEALKILDSFISIKEVNDEDRLSARKLRGQLQKKYTGRGARHL